MIRPLAHRTIDYVVGVVLLLAPLLFVFWDIASATWVAILSGLALIIYSLFTSYTAGMNRALGFNTHLTFDVILGIFLAISPWLFGFAGATWNVWVPHLLVGLALAVISFVTERVGAREPGMAGQLGGEAPPEDEFRRRRT
ncbi:MAG: SPW repeat protein [Armatimonadetes bacterium]|nr:SPW repeat protein [Armatimonadota bacterium]